jgi:hypothetical protein
MKLPRWLIFLLSAISLVILAEAVVLFRLKSQPPSPSQPKKTIAVVNRIGLADFRLADEAMLLSYLDEYRFWEKTGPIALVLGAPNVDSSSLVIELLDRQNPSERYLFQYQDRDGGIQQAAGLKIEEGKLHLLLYLRPTLWQSEEKERLDKRLNALLLRLVYMLTHQEVKDLNDETLAAVVKEFLAGGKKFVEIQK